MITLEEAKELSKGYKVVPISMEIMSDIRTPMQVLRILKGVSSHCYMLESVEIRKNGEDIHSLDMTLSWKSHVLTG